jgi:CDP-diacylglycerol--glycerol-3-phosphate 3-phosphatidyltransferase
VNLPNSITVGRVFLVPVFLWLAYRNSDASAVAAFAVFFVASVSDYVDGRIARSRGLESRMGAFLDPLADKLLVGAALLVLVDTREFPLWAALVIGAREIAVQILRTQIVGGGGSMPASKAGKLKTSFQILMVGWWLLPWSDINVGHWALLWIVLVTTITSGVEYFVRARSPEVVT